MSFVPNPECPWVTATNGERVKVESVGYVNADLSGGNLGIYVFAHFKKLYRWGVPFDLILPGSLDHFAVRPNLVIDLAGGGFDPAHGVGPFTLVCDDAKVEGMGLPLNRHVIYVVTFRLVAV